MGRSPRAALILCASLVCGVAGLLLMPAATLAQGAGKGKIAPPGNSGVSQYVEDVPTVKGGKPSSSIVLPPTGTGGPGDGSSSGGSGGGQSSSSGATGGAVPAPSTATLPAPVTRTLEHNGQTGKSAVALAQATAPVVTKQKPVTPKLPTPPTDAVLRSLEGSAGGGGMGAFLPIFLVATLVLLSAAGILTRRRKT